MRSEKAFGGSTVKAANEQSDAQSERLEGLIRETLAQARMARSRADSVLRRLRDMTAASRLFMAEDRNENDVERDTEPAWRQAA